MILAIHIQFFGHLELINQLLDDSLPLQSIVQIRREFEFQIHFHELINVSVLFDVSLFQTVLDVLDRNSNSLFVVELIISCRLVQSVFFGEILEGTTVILRRTTDILRRTTVILRHALHGWVVVSRSHWSLLQRRIRSLLFVLTSHFSNFRLCIIYNLMIITGNAVTHLLSIKGSVEISDGPALLI